MAHVRKRGDTYTITSSLGYDEQGKQIRKFTTFKPPNNVTEGKALKLANEYAVLWEERIRGYVPLNENKTLKELADWYYDSIAPSVLRPNVVASNKSDIYTHIIPRIGNVKMKHITPQMLDELFLELYRSGNNDVKYKLRDNALLDGINRRELAEKAKLSCTNTIYKLLNGNPVFIDNAKKISKALGLPLNKVFEDATPNKGLAASTVRKTKLNLSAIFTMAVKKQIIKVNPCKFVTLPKVEIPPAEFLNEEQSKTLLDALNNQNNLQLKAIVNLFLASGMRAGELLALHYEDINFETGVVNIKHSLTRVKGAFLLQPTKTPKSKRRIKLPPYIIGLLLEHKNHQDYIKEKCYGVFEHNGAVFTNETGGYLHKGTVSGQMKRVAEAAGLENLHLHTLRHTHASLLINSDIAAKVVADRLGHSDTRTTLNIYTHIFEETEAKAMQAVEMKLFQDKEPAQGDNDERV